MSGATCPYFGKDSKTCQVGCVPATADHLKTISTHCAFSFRDCGTYQEISGRLTPADHGETMALAGARGIGSLGLVYWGASLLLLVLSQSDLPLMSVHGLSCLMVLSALIQVFSGLRMISTAPVRAVAFTGYGLFWLSMIALEILPGAGVGASPGAFSLASYLFLWSLFGIIVCQEKALLSLGARISFGLFSLTLLCQAGALMLGTPVLNLAAMVIGGNGGLLAIAFGLMHHVDHRKRPATVSG